MPATLKRILSAGVMIPLVLWLIFRGHPAVLALTVALLLFLALHEFYSLAPVPLTAAERWVGLTLAVALPLSFWNGRPAPLELLLLGSLLLGGLSLFDPRELEARTLAGTHALFGIVYVALPLSLLYPLRYAPLGQSGEFRLLFLLIPQWLQDTAAFFVGSRWGRHRMAPTISPKKSWEGAAAGLIAAVGGSLAFHFLAFAGTRWSQVLVYGLVLGAAGQASDLAESLFKRAVKVKDSSQLIPGHGGVLDRMDGLLFAAPVYWLLWLYWPL